MADDIEKRCYICGRTEEEVKDYFYTEYDPDEDGPLMEDHVGLQHSCLCLCMGCHDLLSGMFLKENDYMKAVAAEQMSETIDRITVAIVTERKRISKLF